MPKITHALGALALAIALTTSAAAKSVVFHNTVPDDPGGREIAAGKLIPDPNKHADFSVRQVCTRPGAAKVVVKAAVGVTNDLTLSTGDNAGMLVGLLAQKRKAGFAVFGHAKQGWTCEIWTTRVG